MNDRLSIGVNLDGTSLRVAAYSEGIIATILKPSAS